jgi:hypothetical protein
MERFHVFFFIYLFPFGSNTSIRVPEAKQTIMIGQVSGSKFCVQLELSAL